jgi:hypothetical protein
MSGWLYAEGDVPRSPGDAFGPIEAEDVDGQRWDVPRAIATWSHTVGGITRTRATTLGEFRPAGPADAPLIVEGNR